MTNRERFLAFASFQPVDRVPHYATYVEDLRHTLTKRLGADPYDHFRADDGAGAPLRPPEGYVATDYSHYFPEHTGNPAFTIDANGCGHLSTGFYHFTEYISPLRNAESFDEIESYPFHHYRGWLDDRMRTAGQAAHDVGRFSWIFAGHIYENSWQVRGYEPFLMDLMTRRDWAEYILDKFTDNVLAVATAAARAGYDCVATGDDVANQRSMMFDPELWRTVLKPRWAKVYQAVRAIKPDIHIWYHSDGNVWDILDDLVEIGVNILNPVQPECLDPVAVRRRMGTRLAFDGCIGTQTTFPFGTPAEMRRQVRQVCDDLDGLSGGLMLSPTHALEPEVPPENIEAFFEACDALRSDDV